MFSPHLSAEHDLIYCFVNDVPGTKYCKMCRAYEETGIDWSSCRNLLHGDTLSITRPLLDSDLQFFLHCPVNMEAVDTGVDAVEGLMVLPAASPTSDSDSARRYALSAHLQSGIVKSYSVSRQGVDGTNSGPAHFQVCQSEGVAERGSIGCRRQAVGAVDTGGTGGEFLLGPEQLQQLDLLHPKVKPDAHRQSASDSDCSKSSSRSSSCASSRSSSAAGADP